jgi:hypothetical protein
MAKDQNAVAKRHRVVQKKHKVNLKSERCTKKKHMADESYEPNKSHGLLSPAELDVLCVFRNYLMAPGEMLCFGSSGLESFKVPLAQLTSKGFLIVERFRGGYSLTEMGFAAMKYGESARRDASA